MKLNSKLTGGLAWAGLIVVLAVPAADMLMGRDKGATGTDAIRTAAVPAAATKAPVATTAPAPVKVPAIETAAVKGADPVDTYVQSGKKLPSYISDAPTEVASEKPAPATKLVVPGVPTTTTAVRPPVETTGTVKPVDVANVKEMRPDLVAPIPYPASKRPRVPLTASPAATVPVVAATEKPLIVDEGVVQRRDEAVARVLDDDALPPRRVEADQLEQWDSGSLADYLERKGLMSGQAQASNPDFDEDGFYLEDERSSARVVRRVRRNDFFFF